MTSLLLVLNEAESVQFGFKTIEAATSNFSEVNKLGAGGFGEVYKVLISCFAIYIAFFLRK